MLNTLGGIVGVLVLVGAVGLIATKGAAHSRIRSKLWKLILFSVIVLGIIGYLRMHDIR